VTNVSKLSAFLRSIICSTNTGLMYIPHGNYHDYSGFVEGMYCSPTTNGQDGRCSRRLLAAVMSVSDVCIVCARAVDVM
jgi:hypothetical protein